MSKLGELGKFAREALELEKATPAGRVNAFAMVLGFVILSGSAAMNLAQVVGRAFDSKYTLPEPPTVAIFAIFAGYTLLCVLILALMERPRN